MNFYLDSFLEELNINDFFLILAIHLFEHDLYLKIKNNENSLIVKKEFTNKYKNFQIETSTDVFENIFKNKKWNYLKETLIFLFPILNSEQQQISYETYINWEKNHKLCSEKYFENYFTLSLENYEITITSLNQLIKLNEIDEIYNYCTKETNLSYNHSLLRGFKNLIPEVPLENHEFFIKGLMKAGDSIKIHHYSRKYFNWIFNDLFEGIKSKNKYYRILKECIEYYENNILTLSEYIYSIAFDYSLTRENENIKTENDMIISKSQTNHLIKLIINKIHKSSANKEFLNQKFLKDMLIFWERLEDKQTVKKYILENVKTTNEILSFLNKFKTIPEDGIEEYPKSKLVFDLESLTKYHSLKFYEEIINNKLSNEDLNKNDRKYFETFIIQSQEFKQKKRSLFITYCSNIKETYRVLEKWINGSDINWENSYEIFDSDIPHSDIKFEQTIDNAIKNSSVFIILLGMCNSQKEMGWINKELKIAQKYNKPILAIKYGENEIPTNIKETADKTSKSDVAYHVGEISISAYSF